MTAGGSSLIGRGGNMNQYKRVFLEMGWDLELPDVFIKNGVLYFRSVSGHNFAVFPVIVYRRGAPVAVLRVLELKYGADYNVKK
jgi:hypothetical protein